MTELICENKHSNVIFFLEKVTVQPYNTIDKPVILLT